MGNLSDKLFYTPSFNKYWNLSSISDIKDMPPHMFIKYSYVEMKMGFSENIQEDTNLDTLMDKICPEARLVIYLEPGGTIECTDTRINISQMTMLPSDDGIAELELLVKVVKLKPRLSHDKI